MFLPDSFLQCQNSQNAGEEHRDKAEGLEEQLREQEEAVKDLKEQLALAKMNLKDAEVKYASQVHRKKKGCFFSNCVFLTPPLTLM